MEEKIIDSVAAENVTKGDLIMGHSGVETVKYVDNSDEDMTRILTEEDDEDGYLLEWDTMVNLYGY